MYVKAAFTPTPANLTEPFPLNEQVIPSGKVTFQVTSPKDCRAVNCSFSYKNVNAKLSP